MANSRKQAVDEPARRRRLALVEALAEKPEAAAAGILDEVIVARRLRRVMAVAPAPPFAGNAFRAFGAGDVVGHAAPAETPGRTIGNERGDFGRLGAWKNEQRARLFRLRPFGCFAYDFPPVVPARDC